ncbi:TniQ family protein [Wohlfahrtiimonas chitiniclastica]|uniref:TniQ family protein n=1 Tax=Wohlfahrtiimonas chitiniclastica TaxID=400946 RepID=UPI001BCDBFFD|nr:TniQ family protein [Wohlfahrtiimonas chitiniclastica]MBS7821455.1 TniQ family protein [Wohlfahrtiimonas chitiniclastica]
MIELESCTLVKPIYHFPILDDEDSLGYLYRLAHANHYDSYVWLIPTELRRMTTSTKPSMKLIEQLLQQTKWTEHYRISELSQEISDINNVLRGSLTKIRFCPQCVAEQTYIRAIWTLSSSTTCLKHKSLLIDNCPKCHTGFTIKQILTGACSCEEKFNRYPLIHADLLYLQMQHFIQHASLKSYETKDTQFIFQAHPQSLEDRLRLIQLMSSWLPKNSNAKSKKISFNNLSNARNIAKNLSHIIFTTRANFIIFLDQLIHLATSNNINTYSLFIKFYRNFYKQFPSDSQMRYYKRIIESYYRDSLLLMIYSKYISIPYAQVISMPDALKKVGNKIELTLPKIITAILNDTIRIRMISTKPEGFRGIGLHRIDLEKFILLHTQKPQDHSSIPDIAKALSVNQEFAYQLVNHNLLGYTTIKNIRYITNKQLFDFKEKYEILAHYCTQQNTSSAYTIKLLSHLKIFPVDHNWPEKLRQKVYLRTDLDKISHATMADIYATYLSEN